MCFKIAIFTPVNLYFTTNAFVHVGKSTKIARAHYFHSAIAFNSESWVDVSPNVYSFIFKTVDISVSYLNLKLVHFVVFQDQSGSFYENLVFFLGRIEIRRIRQSTMSCGGSYV